MRLRPEVAADLARRGIEPGPDDTPAALREKLDELYLAEVRRLRERRRAGGIPLGDYARQVDELKRSYGLLGLPPELWLA